MSNITMKIGFIALLLLLVIGVTFAGGTKYTMKIADTWGKTQAEKAITPVGQGDIDTLVYYHNPNITGLSFYIFMRDSFALDRVTIRRIYHTAKYGPYANVQTASIDTLSTFTSLLDTASAGTNVFRMADVTLKPYPSEYWFIIDHGSSGRGVSPARSGRPDAYGIIEHYK